jgi:hypothetical protein
VLVRFAGLLDLRRLLRMPAASWDLSGKAVRGRQTGVSSSLKANGRRMVELGPACRFRDGRAKGVRARSSSNVGRDLHGKQCRGPGWHDMSGGSGCLCEAFDRNGHAGRQGCQSLLGQLN